jgi:hypothetical protein
MIYVKYIDKLFHYVFIKINYLISVILFNELTQTPVPDQDPAPFRDILLHQRGDSEGELRHREHGRSPALRHPPGDIRLLALPGIRPVHAAAVRDPERLQLSPVLPVFWQDL